jgi:chromosomal replication initiator protein
VDKVSSATHPTWDLAVDSVASLLGDDDTVQLLTGLRPVGRRGDTFAAEATDTASAELARKRCGKLLEGALAEHSGGVLRHLEITVARGGQQELFPAAVAVPRPDRSAQDRAALNSKYTFENFIVGASNQFAHAASLAVAHQPGETYNPLFVYGGVGLGKTHLACAIGNDILDRCPESRVVYLSADSFMSELIAAMRRDRMEEFKRRFRRVDVLILDDVQFLAGRERTQEEFFHTFNALYEAHKQIVLTSDKFPKEIPSLEERLRNRFESGLIADIQTPDIETRLAILEKKAENDKLALPSDVAVFLAETFDSNVRELEGSLTRLHAHASLNGSPLNLELARRVLKSFVDNRADSGISIERIQKTVSDYFHIQLSDLISKTRTRHIAHPRQIAMYLCRRHTDASFPVIGDRFGGRDHSTVIHAHQVVERRMKQDATLRQTIESLTSRIEGND